MANTLTLTVDVLTKNAKDLDDLTGKVGKLDTAAGNAAPKADKTLLDRLKTNSEFPPI